MGYKEFTVTKMYYTIGEVAEQLGVSVSTIRFWSDKFARHIKPHRNNKGNRLFTQADFECLRTIHYLIKEKGMTLEGANMQITNNREQVDKSVEIAQTLKSIRSKLLEVQDSL